MEASGKQQPHEMVVSQVPESTLMTGNTSAPAPVTSNPPIYTQNAPRMLPLTGNLFANLVSPVYKMEQHFILGPLKHLLFFIGLWHLIEFALR